MSVICSEPVFDRHSLLHIRKRNSCQSEYDNLLGAVGQHFAAITVPPTQIDDLEIHSLTINIRYD